jgi:dephospho-CoA kinase
LEASECMPVEPLPLIGIVGGVASGKSLVSEQLQRKGAAVVTADALAHQVLEFDDVKSQLRERWGDAIFSANGAVDRARLAKIVFAPPPDGPRELKALEQVTHPRIGALARQRLQELQEERTAPAIVLDVPLLFESGWNTVCDTIVFVDAPGAIRLERALARGWSAEEFARREAAQRAIDDKRQQADLVIDNSGSRQATQDQIDAHWPTLITARHP